MPPAFSPPPPEAEGAGEQVGKKLRLAQLGTFYAKERGTVVARMEDMVDVDDLEVQEIKAPTSETAREAALEMPLSPGADGLHRSGSGRARGEASGGGPGYVMNHGDDDSQNKYGPKASPIARIMTRLGVSAPPAGLPFTVEGKGEGRGGAGGAKRKRKGAWKRRDYIAAAVVVCTFGSMALLYLHMMDQFS